MSEELSTERRERFLRNLIKEAFINVLAEQEAMSAVPSAVTPPSPQTNVMDPNQPMMQQGPAEFTVDSMVEKLNTLRSGRSFTDPEIYGRLTTFFNSLTEEQRGSLEWVLNEINQIVLDVEQPAEEMQQTQAQSQSAQPAPPAPAPASPPAGPAAPVSPAM